MTGAVPRDKVAGQQMIISTDPDLKRKTEELIKLQKVLYKQQKLRIKMNKNVDEIQVSDNYVSLTNQVKEAEQINQQLFSRCRNLRKHNGGQKKALPSVLADNQTIQLG